MSEENSNGGGGCADDRNTLAQLVFQRGALGVRNLRALGSWRKAQEDDQDPHLARSEQASRRKVKSGGVSHGTDHFVFTQGAERTVCYKIKDRPPIQRTVYAALLREGRSPPLYLEVFPVL